MAATVGPGGPSTATQFAVDGPGGSVVAGTTCSVTDHDQLLPIHRLLAS